MKLVLAVDLKNPYTNICNYEIPTTTGNFEFLLNIFISKLFCLIKVKEFFSCSFCYIAFDKYKSKRLAFT